jgi:hypothetical protein
MLRRSQHCTVLLLLIRDQLLDLFLSTTVVTSSLEESFAALVDMGDLPRKQTTKRLFPRFRC